MLFADAGHAVKVQVEARASGRYKGGCAILRSAHHGSRHRSEQCAVEVDLLAVACRRCGCGGAASAATGVDERWRRPRDCQGRDTQGRGLEDSTQREEQREELHSQSGEAAGRHAAKSRSLRFRLA